VLFSRTVTSIMRAPRMCPGAEKAQFEMGRKRERLGVVDGSKLLQRFDCFLVGIKRQRGLVLAEALEVGVLRVFFLQVAGIRRTSLASSTEGVEASTWPRNPSLMKRGM